MLPRQPLCGRQRCIPFTFERTFSGELKQIVEALTRLFVKSG